MRDSQKQKVYDAEGTAWQRSKSDAALVAGSLFPDLDALQAWVDSVVGSAWWRQRYGPGGVRVLDGRGRGRAGQLDWHTITHPKWTRCRWQALHELAHIAITRTCRTPHASHGWQFTACYLGLVRRFLGRDAHAELRAAFKAHRVRYSPPRSSSPSLSPEQAAARDARLAAAREAAAAKRAAEEAADPLSVVVSRGNFRGVFGCRVHVSVDGEVVISTNAAYLMTAKVARAAALKAGREAALEHPGSAVTARIEGFWRGGDGRVRGSGLADELYQIRWKENQDVRSA